MGYFTINVSSDYVAPTTVTPLQVVFTVGGADAAIFKAPSNMTFAISDAPAETGAGSITSWDKGTATKTSQTFSPKVT